MIRMGLMALVRIYQWTIRPMIGAHCRFEPSCSDYALEALGRYGAFRGTWLAAHRIIRCNPWVSGGFDPVPGGTRDSCGCNRRTGVSRRWMGL
jgi:putative membrane protein insertion efficiency factor